MSEDVIEWVENNIGRKLTEEEVGRIEIDAKASKEINTGTVEDLKRHGIDLEVN